ncbi:unnamed protein product [Clavelina lepadiformis]|uniref:Uncharacterized protein n=1 Tax=Clavelina lepadiformis TaxID=159417 RepID=A0ABP0FLX6_CLALP
MSLVSIGRNTFRSQNSESTKLAINSTRLHNWVLSSSCIIIFEQDLSSTELTADLASDALLIMDQEKFFEEQNHLKMEDKFVGKGQSSSNDNNFSDYRTLKMSEQSAGGF